MSPSHIKVFCHGIFIEKGVSFKLKMTRSFYYTFFVECRLPIFKVLIFFSLSSPPFSCFSLYVRLYVRLSFCCCFFTSLSLLIIIIDFVKLLQEIKLSGLQVSSHTLWDVSTKLGLYKDGTQYMGHPVLQPCGKRAYSALLAGKYRLEYFNLTPPDPFPVASLVH